MSVPASTAIKLHAAPCAGGAVVRLRLGAAGRRAHAADEAAHPGATGTSGASRARPPGRRSSDQLAADDIPGCAGAAGSPAPIRPSRQAFGGARTDPQNVHMEKAELTGSLVTATRLAFTAALGGFLFGYDSAVINGAITAIGDHYHISASRLGFTVSSALLGAAVGAVLAGRVADRFGRVRAMVLAAVLFLISALGAGLVDTLGLLIVFRVIGGIGVGMASVIAPAYIAEIAPASIRGRLGSLQQLAIVTGIFVALLADYVLARVAGGSEHDLAFGLEAWR
jgi:hypothetical protein